MVVTFCNNSVQLLLPGLLHSFSVLLKNSQNNSFVTRLCLPVWLRHSRHFQFAGVAPLPGDVFSLITLPTGSFSSSYMSHGLCQSKIQSKSWTPVENVISRLAGTGSQPANHVARKGRQPQCHRPTRPSPVDAGQGAAEAPQPQAVGVTVRGAAEAPRPGAAIEAVHGTAEASRPRAVSDAKRGGAAEGSGHEFGYGLNFSDRYVLGAKIATGGFGTVFAATSNRTGKQRAVKVISKKFDASGTPQPLFARRVRHEVDVNNHLRGSLNVASLLGAYEDKNNVYLVIQLCSGGELWDALKRGSYGERDARLLLQDILRTCGQCHSRHVVIRDVKPENFMFADASPGSALKAIDFGLACFCNPGGHITDRAGTVIYVAPEVLKQKYSFPADIWSCGIIACLLLAGRLPFSGEEGQEVTDLYMSKHHFVNKDVFRAVLYSDLDLEWDSVSADARDLVAGLLQRDPAKRLTAEQALRHRWFQAGDASLPGPFSDSLVQRIQRYGALGRLKQVALRALTRALIASDSDLLLELRAVFRTLDTDGTGCIPYEALGRKLRGGHFSLSDAELDQLLDNLDIDHEGLVTFEAWVSANLDWGRVQQSDEWRGLVQGAFEAMDRDHSGQLERGDLETELCGEVCEIPDMVDAALREGSSPQNVDAISLPDFERLLSENLDGDQLRLFASRLIKSGADES